MVRPIPIDDVEGLFDALRDLESLRRVLRERRKPESRDLREWCILGRLYLDRCGNAMPIVEGVPDEYAQHLPAVLPWSELCAYLPKDAMVSSSSRYALPAEGARCERCGEPWSIRDFWTARCAFGDEAWYHLECLRFMIYDREVERVRDIFANAGMDSVTLTSIPNGYWPKSANEYPPPWFLVDVHGLGRISIGKRKRVWSIDWSRCALRSSPDFSAENVTTWPTGVHAWSTEQASSYLRTIRGLAAAPQNTSNSKTE